MNDVASSRPNSLSEWGQNWMDVLAFDPAALDRGIGYIYQLLSLPKPTIHYVDGWREGILLVLKITRISGIMP